MKEGTKQAVYGAKVLDELQAVAERNGRILWKSRADGELYATADKYTGTDYHAGSAEDLLEWERGYTTAKDPAQEGTKEAIYSAKALS